MSILGREVQKNHKVPNRFFSPTVSQSNSYFPWILICLKHNNGAKEMVQRLGALAVCSSRRPEFGPSSHITCDSSFRELQTIYWSLQASALQCTYPHRHIHKHNLKMKIKKHTQHFIKLFIKSGFIKFQCDIPLSQHCVNKSIMFSEVMTLPLTGTEMLPSFLSIIFQWAVAAGKLTHGAVT